MREERYPEGSGETRRPGGGKGQRPLDCRGVRDSTPSEAEFHGSCRRHIVGVLWHVAAAVRCRRRVRKPDADSGDKAPGLGGLGLPAANGQLVVTPDGWADDEGASPRYRFRWYVNGQLSSPLTARRVGLSSLPQGGVVMCRASPWDGIAEGPSFQSGFFVVLRLCRGWNLISIPVVLSNPDPAAVFASSREERPYEGTVWAWDARFGAFRPASEIEPCRGYWLWCPDETPPPVVISAAERAPAPALPSGTWSLAGRPVDPAGAPLALGRDARAGLPAPWLWEASGQRYRRADPAASPLSGFWILADKTPGPR